jgi:hypothetical protein
MTGIRITVKYTFLCPTHPNITVRPCEDKTNPKGEFHSMDSPSGLPVDWMLCWQYQDRWDRENRSKARSRHSMTRTSFSNLIIRCRCHDNIHR